MSLEYIFPPLIGGFAAAAAVIAYVFRKKPRKPLIVLVGANIILDIIAVVLWQLPELVWTVYRGYTVAVAEAGVAAALFAIVLFGLIKHKAWAPKLAIGLTIVQRVFATYFFFPSAALALTLIWSLLIIYFAIRIMKQKT